jgi:hypothetical protein
MNEETTKSQALTVAATPMQMLQMAVSQNADLDKLSKLMDLQERWEKNEARKAFDAAMAAFKSNPPQLFKNKQVKFATSKGTTEYKHATLDQVAIAVGEALAPHGLSFRWNVEQIQGKIRVTCILAHAAGHSECVQMEGGADDSGLKNSIQQVGSTVTYLERYTLLAATGMAVKDQDDDGAAATISAGHSATLLGSIKNAANLNDLQVAFKDAYTQAVGAKDKASMAKFIEAKDQRKLELTTAASTQAEPSATSTATSSPAQPVSSDYLYEDGVMDCQVLDVRVKEDVKDGTGAVTKKGSVTVTVNAPDGQNATLSCWHKSLWPALASIQKNMRAIFTVKESGKYLNIEDVRSIGSQCFRDGKAVDSNSNGEV